AYREADRGTAARKLGLAEDAEGAADLIDRLQALMQAAHMDMTLAFRALADMDPQRPSTDTWRDAFYEPDQAAPHLPALQAWLDDWAGRLAGGRLYTGQRRERMRAASPRYVLRNYLAQQAIDRAEAGDPGGVHELLEVMRRPYEDQPGHEAYAARRPDWARTRAGCSMLSCSSRACPSGVRPRPA